MIIKETALRSRIRDLLLEERVYKIKELLEDIEFYRDFEEGELEQIEQRLRSNWDRGYSKFSQVIKKDVINTQEPIDHILNAIDNFMPYYSKVGPRMTQQIGQGKLSSSDLRSYIEAQASDKLNKTRTDQRIRCRKQVPIKEGQECKDFKVIHADHKWTVVYPKTMLGSMSWAVGLADGSEEVYEVDSNGRQAGRVGWCTASYTNNRFPMYAGNLHMYYFVKNSGYEISDRNRRLCVSLSKNGDTGEVQIHYRGNATVNADNVDLPENEMLSLIGNEIVEKMKSDASSRKSTSLSEMASRATLAMIKQDIENLKNDPEILEQQLYIYARNAKNDEIIRFFSVHEDPYIRVTIASRSDLPEKYFAQFAKDENDLVRKHIVKRDNLPEDLIKLLAKDESEGVRLSIAAKKDLSKYERIFEDIIKLLAKDKSDGVRSFIAKRSDLPEDFVRDLAKDKSKNVRGTIAKRKDLPEYLVVQLAQDRSALVRSDIADRKDLSKYERIFKDLLKQFAKDENEDIRSAVANRSDLPPYLVKQLAKDEKSFVRSVVANRIDLYKVDKDLIRQLAQDKASGPRLNIAKRDDLDRDLLEKLAQDENVFVRIEIAKRKNLPGDVIEQLAKDKSPFVKRNIAYRKDLSKDIVLLLAQEQTLSIKTSIASNPNLPEHFIEKFLEDENKNVVNAAIENPNIPNNIYNNLIEKSKFYWEKAGSDDNALNTLFSIIRNPKFKREYIDEMGKLPADIVELLSFDQMVEDIYASCPHLREIIRESGYELDEERLENLMNYYQIEETRLLKSYINMLLS